jgi:hypothetical protein
MRRKSLHTSKLNLEDKYNIPELTAQLDEACDQSR